MAETFDYKEGFRQGWSTLWTIMSGIDLLMDYIPQRRKNDALTTALTTWESAVFASAFYDEVVTIKLRMILHLRDIIFAIVDEDWDKAFREVMKLRDKIPVRKELPSGTRIR